jgi:hypothetical protein
MLILNSYGPSQGSECQRTEPPVDVIIACNCHEGWFDWVLKFGPRNLNLLVRNGNLCNRVQIPIAVHGTPTG